MKTIIAAILFLPMLTQAQNTIKPAKCNYEINGVDAFTGEAKKTSQWFNISGEAQPVIQLQLMQEGDNYFINLALSPYEFSPSRYIQGLQGYDMPDSLGGNNLKVKLANGQVLSFRLLTNHTLNSSIYTSNIITNNYSAIYSISKEQLEQLASQNVTKARVYHDNGYYYELNNIDAPSRDTFKNNAACMLQ